MQKQDYCQFHHFLLREFTEILNIKIFQIKSNLLFYYPATKRKSQQVFLFFGYDKIHSSKVFSPPKKNHLINFIRGLIKTSKITENTPLLASLDLGMR